MVPYSPNPPQKEKHFLSMTEVISVVINESSLTK